MKKILFLITLAAFLGACSPSTKIVNSWHDPNVVLSTNKIHKFLVAAFLKDLSTRRQVEDYMASMFPGKAVQSYLEFGNDELNEKDDFYNQKLAGEGFDGIAIMRLINVDKSTRYVPGSYPVYYSSWRGYWGYSRLGYYTPAYYTIDKTYNVEVNVYSLKSNKMIWTGSTSTISPSSHGNLFKDVSKAVYKKMKDEGFLQ